jgi:hypothetical protein
MAVYNYENITYHVTGMSVINDPKGTKQEGILIYLQITKPSDDRLAHARLTIFLDKHDCAHIAKTTQEGKRFWTRFRLSKMVHQ